MEACDTPVMAATAGTATLSGIHETGHSAQQSVVYAVHAAEGHRRERNQEGPRRVHACTAMLSERHLTPAELPGQARLQLQAVQLCRSP